MMLIKKISHALRGSFPYYIILWLMVLVVAGAFLYTPSISFAADITPPSIPAGLLAVYYPSPYNQFGVFWSASTDHVGVVGYNVYRNGKQIATTTNTYYYEYGIAPGTTYTYAVAAYNAAGYVSAQSASVSVSAPQFSVDTIPPTVSITSPTMGSSYTVGTLIPVNVSASDNIGVTKSEFYVDGTLLTTSMTSPWGFTWNTMGTSGVLPAITHTLTVKAYDAAGNVGTSASISVTVNNLAPMVVLSTLTPSSGPIGTQVTITGTGFTQAGNKIAFGNLGSEYNPSYSLNSSDGKTLVFTVPSSNYYACQNSQPPCLLANSLTQPGTYQVSVMNTNGTSNALTFTVTSSSTSSVLITSPTNGQTVSGSVAVNVSISDSSSITRTELYVDGILIAVDGPLLPNWNFIWYTIVPSPTTVPSTSNGPHTLVVKAYDAAGSILVSPPVTVTVNNTTPDTTPPSVPTGLSASAISSSQINLSWTASTDNVGVTGYNVYRSIQGCNTCLIVPILIGTTQGAIPSYSDLGLTASTTYAYSIAAYDAAGNVSAQSAPLVGATTLSGGVSPSQPPPVGNLNKFNIGDHIATTANLKIRSTPSISATGRVLCIQPKGASGTVIGGPVVANGYTWWNINYDSGCNGWSVENYLSFVSGIPTDTIPPSVPTGLVASAISSSEIDLSWTVSTDNVGVSGYNIYRGIQGCLTCQVSYTLIGATAGTVYQDTNLATSTAYSYTVAAFDAAGNISAQSAPAGTVTTSNGTATVAALSAGIPVLFICGSNSVVQVRHAIECYDTSSPPSYINLYLAGIKENCFFLTCTYTANIAVAMQTQGQPRKTYVNTALTAPFSFGTFTYKGESYSFDVSQVSASNIIAEVNAVSVASGKFKTIKSCGSVTINGLLVNIQCSGRNHNRETSVYPIRFNHAYPNDTVDLYVPYFQGISTTGLCSGNCTFPVPQGYSLVIVYKLDTLGSTTGRYIYGGDVFCDEYITVSSVSAANQTAVIHITSVRDPSYLYVAGQSAACSNRNLYTEPGVGGANRVEDFSPPSVVYTPGI